MLFEREPAIAVPHRGTRHETGSPSCLRPAPREESGPRREKRETPPSRALPAARWFVGDELIARCGVPLFCSSLGISRCGAAVSLLEIAPLTDLYINVVPL